MRQWIDATSATYVKSDDLATPMGTGIAAYASAQAARSAAADISHGQGGTFSRDQLLGRLKD
jgi:nitrous oxide reductase accessory protein NosL